MILHDEELGYYRLPTVVRCQNTGSYNALGM